MGTTVSAYRIFIASPGGLQAERQAFRDAISSYNDSEAIPRGAMFIPVGWELTPGGVGRPQSIINAEIRECDYFVLLLWNRWGSPPDAEGNYTSGTEEEFGISLECYHSSSHPMRRLVVMFKAPPPEQLSDPGEQLLKVLEFKRRMEKEKQHLFHTFDTTESFTSILRKHLGVWLREHEHGFEKPEPEPTVSPALAVHNSVPRSTLSGAQLSPILVEAKRLTAEGQNTDAEALYAQAIARGDDPEPFIQYGNFLRSTGRTNQALEMFRRAIEISDSTSDDASLTIACVQAARVARTRGEYDEAESLGRRALEVSRRNGLDHQALGAYAVLGDIQVSRGNLSVAEHFFRSAIELGEHIKSDRGVLSVSTSLGHVLLMRGQREEAEPILVEAVRIADQMGNLEAKASALGTLGILAHREGDHRRAEQVQRQAIELNETLGNTRGLAVDFGNLGSILHAQGNFTEAEQMHRKALELDERLGNVSGIAEDYGNLGIVLASQNDLTGAEEMHRKSLEIEERLGRLGGLASDYYNLGNILWKQKRLPEALEHYRKGRELFNKAGMRVDAEKALLMVLQLEQEVTKEREEEEVPCALIAT